MRLSDKVMAHRACRSGIGFYVQPRAVVEEVVEETVALAARLERQFQRFFWYAVPAVLRVPAVRPQTQAVVPVRPAVQVPAQKKRV